MSNEAKIREIEIRIENLEAELREVRDELAKFMKLDTHGKEFLPREKKAQ